MLFSQVHNVSVLTDAECDDHKLIVLEVNEKDEIHLVIHRSDRGWQSANFIHAFSTETVCPFCKETSSYWDSCTFLNRSADQNVNQIFSDQRFRLKLSFALDLFPKRI